tara:strand:- start:496 stop:996 length:501 start_codon:yes stop_codon:yes gene_type:complete
MWITGYTSSRLNEVKTLDINEPYKVGVNGVLSVTPDYIEYKIDDIFYKTYTPKPSMGKPNFQKGIKGTRVTVTKKIKNYITPPQIGEPVQQNTTFRFQNINNNFETYPSIKEENKLEQVFLPEIEDEIFIERGAGNIYEKHMRLMDINNIGQLETYKNGFYFIKKN